MPDFPMHRSWLCKALVVLVAGLATPVALAQATRTWVSGVGDDVNPCSRTAPCKTFAGAISKTAAGGEIDALDPGGFGAVTITKSITIDGSGGSVATILAAGTTGVIVNGAGVVVVLRNLTISGAGTGINGIRFLNGSSLTLQNVAIENFTQAAVLFAPSTTADLLIHRTTLHHSEYGLLAQPGASGSANVVVTDSTMDGNAVSGLRAEDRSTVAVQNTGFQSNGGAGFNAVSSGGPINVSIVNSAASQNGGHGFAGRVPGGTGTVNMMLLGSTSSQNLGDGLCGIGPASIVVGSSKFWANAGTGINPKDGATILSQGNNINRNNGAPGAPTGLISTQ